MSKAKPNKIASLEAIEAYNPEPRDIVISHPHLGEFHFREILDGREFAEITLKSTMATKRPVPLTIKVKGEDVEVLPPKGTAGLIEWALACSVDPKLDRVSLYRLFHTQAAWTLEMLGQLGIIHGVLPDPSKSSFKDVDDAALEEAVGKL